MAKDLGSKLLETKYNVLSHNGETDGIFTIGDKVQVTIRNHNDDRVTGYMSGIIVEILWNERIHQLRLDNGWGCHPREFFGNDSVTKL